MVLWRSSAWHRILTLGTVLRGIRHCVGGKRRRSLCLVRWAPRIAQLVVSATAFGCLALTGTAHADTTAPDILPGSNATATVLQASPGTAVTNETVTLTATVSSAIGAPFPAGTVAFENGGATIGTCGDVSVSPTAQSVTALCSTAFAASTAQLTAVFTPSEGSFLTGSVSPIESVLVGPAPSSTSLDASSSVAVGIRTILTATVTASSTGLGAMEPSGAVEFLDAGQPIGSCSSQPLMDGAATCAVTYGGAGAHAVTARYLGDANFAASSSPTEFVRAIPTPAGGPGAAEGARRLDHLDDAVDVLVTRRPTRWSAPLWSTVRRLARQSWSTATAAVVRSPGARSTSPTTSSAASRCGACARHRAQVLITPGFENRHLGVGARITVAIMKPSWVGKYYAFTIEPRRGPRVQIACLAPGASRPGGDC